MAAVSVPNRPFSSEPVTGLSLPDGIFETSIGAQRINAHFKNLGAAATPLSMLTSKAYPIQESS
jgi:hypothetical protein